MLEFTLHLITKEGRIFGVKILTSPFLKVADGRRGWRRTLGAAKQTTACVL